MIAGREREREEERERERERERKRERETREKRERERERERERIIIFTMMCTTISGVHDRHINFVVLHMYNEKKGATV